MNIIKFENNNKKLIVFFSGWGMDYKPFEHIKVPDGFDFFFVYDYNSLDIDLSTIDNYTEKYLIAWSFGVKMAAIVFKDSTIFDKTIAINGTQKPIDDEFGIPKAIFDGTLSTLSEENLIKFNKRMCFANKEALSQLQQNLPKRTIDSLKNELIYFKNSFFENKNTNFAYSKIILSVNDRIFPYQNMLKYWEHQASTRIHTINKSHYFFNDVNNWNEIIELDEQCK